MAERIYLKQQRGWWITPTPQGSRYYYRGQRKSQQSFDRSRQRAEKKYEGLAGWKSREQFKEQMSTPESQRWAEAIGEDAEDFEPGDEFSQMYLAAMESEWSHDAHGEFAEFLDWLGVRDESDYDIGEYDEGVEPG